MYHRAAPLGKHLARRPETTSRAGDRAALRARLPAVLAPRPVLLCIALLALTAACATSTGPEEPGEAPETTWRRATAQADRAHRSFRKGDLVVAERHYEKALAAARSFPEGDPRLLETRSSLARLHRKQGRYRLAMRELEALLPAQERAHGTTSTEYTVTLHSLCGARLDAGRHAEARTACLRVLAIQEASPATKPGAVDATRLDLAAAELGLRHFEAAEKLYRELLAAAQRGRTTAASSALEVRAETGLGLLYAAQRRYSEAEPHFLKALAILVRRRARNGPYYPIVLRDLGDLFVRTRRNEEARERYELALERFEETYGKDHFEVRETMLRIADLLARTGKPRKAAELRYQAEAIPDPRT